MSVQGELDVKWTVQSTRTGTGAGAPVKIPGWLNELSLGLDPNGNTAAVEITLSDPTEIDLGTANWFLWDPGQVTTKTIRGVVGPCSGVRISQSAGAGTSTLFVAGQRSRP